MASDPPVAGMSGANVAAAAPAHAASAGTRNVVALGTASLCTDISTEMIVPVLPLFVTGTLRASVASLGVIEGVAECTATALRILSGWISDRAGRRKPLMIAGYAISTAAKGALALAGSWSAVLLLRFSDRVGKGMRNPPRDALIAESVPPARLGWAFGLHRALDSLGAAIGPLVAFALLSAWPGGYRAIFAAAAIPAVLALVVLAIFVRSPQRTRQAPAGTLRGTIGTLGAPAWRFLAVAALFSLGSSSMAFVLLRAGQAGMSAAQVALAYAAYNVVYAALSWPVGAWSDRVGRRPLLLAAYLAFAACYALLAARGDAPFVIAALVGLGVHSALLEGSQRSLLADLVGADKRGTAFGVYYAGVGLALLPASILAGWLWDRFGPGAAFATGAALALAAALLFAVLLPARHEHRDRHVHA